jgi:SAM-dependent methyltransferase
MIALALLGALLLLIFLSLYPAELSWFGGRGTRWLYDRAAHRYEEKWARHDYGPYDEAVRLAAREVLAQCSQPRVLDLGCGSGRALLQAAQVLGDEATYTAVDFSAGMLAGLRARIAADTGLASCAVELVQADIGTWTAAATESSNLVLCMEVGEFLPDFQRVLSRIGDLCAPGGRLVMTRPAGGWSLFFPARRQRRQTLLASLSAAGFDDCQVLPWRGRYEILVASRAIVPAASPRAPRSARAERSPGPTRSLRTGS